MFKFVVSKNIDSVFNSLKILNSTLLNFKSLLKYTSIFLLSIIDKYSIDVSFSEIFGFKIFDLSHERLKSILVSSHSETETKL